MNRVITQKQGWRRMVALMAVAFLLVACSGGGHAPPPTPVITMQPADVSVVAGSAASFSVTATGNTPSYQWQSSDDHGTSWANISGATSASYTLATTTLGDSGRLFRVLVTAAGATVASSSAQLTVTSTVQAPAITVQPGNQTVTEPDPATFSITATGTSLQYQWQLSTDSGETWMDIAGATSSSYTTPATAANASGAQFRVKISNAAGNVTSDAAMLTVNPAHVAPSFATQPASQSVSVGATATFGASVSGIPTPALQWQRSNNSGGSWTDIAGAGSDHYSTSATTAGDNGAQFRLIATNSEGSATSDVANLTVTAAASAPVFTAQPQDASVTAGNSAHFSAAASGVPTPSLQWQVSTDNGASWTNINGATSASYDTPVTTGADNGHQYRAVASNSEGSVASHPATLTVTTGLTATARFALGAVMANTCAIKADGTAACWGDNSDGQLGSGNYASSATPVAVFGLANVVAIVTGSNYFACALKADGTVACWGYNDHGALGDGTTVAARTKPVAVSGLSSVIAIASGYQHSCALKADGTVACWGGNGAGQLGNGSTTDSSTPVPVSGLSSVVAIAAGLGHTCAVKADGSVACWGYNGYGVLGNGTTTSSSTPVAVSGLTDAVAVTAGDNHSCALRANGSVSCWGFNANGQLGDNSTSDRSTPVGVSGLVNVATLATSFRHNCAVKTDGTVVCWGNNVNGQLGDGSYTAQATPVPVSGLGSVAGITTGYQHSCALKTDGAVVCWGGNGYGQLGNGSNTGSAAPVDVSGGAVFWK